MSSCIADPSSAVAIRRAEPIIKTDDDDDDANVGRGRKPIIIAMSDGFANVRGGGATKTNKQKTFAWASDGFLFFFRGTLF